MPKKLLLYTALILIVLSCTKDLDDFGTLAEDIHLEDAEITPPISESVLPMEAIYTVNWINQMQFPNGLMESAPNTNFVSLYDNALSALAFLAVGEIQKAEKILDYFNDRIDSELLAGEGGFHQFRNGNGGEQRVIWLGDNAWLLIALKNYKEITGSDKYQELASELEIWIRSLQDESGGLKGGYYEDGSPMHKITEGMVTAFNAVEGYDDFHKGILNFLKNERWNTEDQLLIAWPENESYYYAMDLHSLGYMIFEDFPVSVLDDAERYKTSQTSESTGETISGYCFDEDKDVVWLEGTGQMALAFQHAGMKSDADQLLYELSKAGIRNEQVNLNVGLPYTTNSGSCYGAVPLWDHSQTKPALSSSIWYLFNILEFNPLAKANTKEIPASEKFWIQ